jgi:hypothetical protein
VTTREPESRLDTSPSKMHTLPRITCLGQLR